MPNPMQYCCCCSPSRTAQVRTQHHPGHAPLLPMPPTRCALAQHGVTAAAAGKAALQMLAVPGRSATRCRGPLQEQLLCRMHGSPSEAAHVGRHSGHCQSVVRCARSHRDAMLGPSAMTPTGVDQAAWRGCTNTLRRKHPSTPSAP